MTVSGGHGERVVGEREEGHLYKGWSGLLEKMSSGARCHGGVRLLSREVVPEQTSTGHSWGEPGVSGGQWKASVPGIGLGRQEKEVWDTWLGRASQEAIWAVQKFRSYWILKDEPLWLLGSPASAWCWYPSQSLWDSFSLLCVSAPQLLCAFRGPPKHTGAATLRENWKRQKSLRPAWEPWPQASAN